ncbi:MAG: ATP-binding cassette domain-containing protein, partial [Candidatus Magasanikbacteria bacterium]|nr:ATP-binding cassette domain-containing protein [Candidatus Magasanikbacteria bacterium]
KIRVARLDQEEMLSDIGELTAGEVLRAAAEHYIKEFPVDWAEDNALENQEAQQRIEELSERIAKLFEVDDFLGRQVKDLSGGERTKLSLLMILSSEPDILLLDEPTNHLDLESIAKLRGLFESYKQAGVSIVSVSHVEWFLESAGNDGVMYLRVDPNGARNLQVSGTSYSKFRKSVEHGQKITGQPIEWNKDYKVAASGSQLFSAKKEDGTITIPDSPITDTHLPEMPAGHVVVFSGKNGTGKTKLMEAIAQKDSKVIKREKGVQVAYMPQFWPENIAKGNIRDFFFWVREGVNPHSSQTEAVFLRKIRESSFSYDGTKSLLEKSFSQLSGGEQRLLWFIAASIFEGTDVLMLDEPTNHMDAHIQSRILETIKAFPGTVILSTHDLRLMQGLKEYAGPGREINGVINLVFAKEGGKTTIKKSAQSPVDYANQVITESHNLAKRVKI